MQDLVVRMTYFYDTFLGIGSACHEEATPNANTYFQLFLAGLFKIPAPVENFADR